MRFFIVCVWVVRKYCMKGDEYINIADRSTVTQKNWATGEPNRDGSCIMVDREMNWYDKPCDKKLQSICQRPKGTLPSITGIHNRNKEISII